MRSPLALLVLVGACSILNAAPPGVQLLVPSWGEGVSGKDWVEGQTELKKAGWAVVLLKQGEAGMWEVKAAVKTAPTGAFKAEVPFTGTGTSEGTEMKLVVLAFTTAPNATRYKPGAQFKEIPQAAGASDEVPLVAVKEAERGKIAIDPPKGVAAGGKGPAASLEFPKPGQLVVRHEEFEAKVHQKGYPMILVRAVREKLPNGQFGEPYWWVQPYPISPRPGKPFESDEVIRSKIYVGDSGTAAGEAFRVLLLVAKEDPSKQYPEKTKLRYPPSFPGSTTVKVIRQ